MYSCIYCFMFLCLVVFIVLCLYVFMLFFKTKIFFFFQLFALKLPKNQKKAPKNAFFGP